MYLINHYNLLFDQFKVMMGEDKNLYFNYFSYMLK